MISSDNQKLMLLWAVEHELTVHLSATIFNTFLAYRNIPGLLWQHNILFFPPMPSNFILAIIWRTWFIYTWNIVLSKAELEPDCDLPTSYVTIP